MFKYDTVHGRFNGTVEGKDDGLYINGKKIAVFQCMKVRSGAWVGVLDSRSAMMGAREAGARCN